MSPGVSFKTHAAHDRRAQDRLSFPDQSRIHWEAVIIKATDPAKRDQAKAVVHAIDAYAAFDLLPGHSWHDIFTTWQRQADTYPKRHALLAIMNIHAAVAAFNDYR